MSDQWFDYGAHARVLDFWFGELRPADWYTRSDRVDGEIRERFLELHAMAAAGELEAWRDGPPGRLAEIIVLDQFSRNLFRGAAEAFRQDALALMLAQEAVRLGCDDGMAPERRQFLYMPFMHSESRRIHARAVELFSRPGLQNSLDFELRHKAIIDRFGRYPHRNAALGRQTTTQEAEFLKQPGSSF